MRRKQLQDRKAALIKAGAANLEAAAAENRSLTEAERAEAARIKAELKAVNEELDIYEDQLEAERSMPSVSAPAVPAGATSVSVGAPNHESDPKFGFKNGHDLLNAVMVSGKTGRMDPRLRPLATQGSDEQAAGTLPYGGYLIPPTLGPGLLSLPAESDPLSSRVRNVPMASPTVSFNARVDKNHSSSVSGGLRVSRRPETVDGTPTRMAFEQVTLTANEEFGATFASETILTDSPQSFLALLTAGFADEYVAAAMTERISGTGIGEREGILNAACLITVAKETNQAADTIVTENIDKMAARCWRYEQAIWLANHNTRPALRALVRNVGTGGVPVPYFVNEGGQATLDGRPIFFTEFAKTVGDVGDLILANWSEYLEGSYGGESFAESIHVRFLANERAFKFYRRNDGRWWWRSALSPKNGSSLSPAVVLAAR